MRDIVVSTEGTNSVIMSVPVKNCGIILRSVQIDDGPHPWMSGRDLFVCPGHGENRYKKEPSGPGYMAELRGKAPKKRHCRIYPDGDCPLPNVHCSAPDCMVEDD